MKRFLIIFAAISGLAIAETIKEELLKRTEWSYNNLTQAVSENARRGFDYSAEILNSTAERVDNLRAQIRMLADDITAKKAHSYTEQVKQFEKDIPYQIRMPSKAELFKGWALYLATIKEIKNDMSDPKPVTLKQIVLGIVTQEIYIASLATSDPSRKRAENGLDQMYGILGDQIWRKQVDAIVTPEQLHKFEGEIVKKIEKFKAENDTEEAKNVQEVLNNFQTATYYVGKTFPIDSRTRVHQFLQAAPEHYKLYLVLTLLFSIHD